MKTQDKQRKGAPMNDAQLTLVKNCWVKAVRSPRHIVVHSIRDDSQTPALLLRHELGKGGTAEISFSPHEK